MEEQKLTHKPHVGAKPVKAEPTRDRERALEPSNPPRKVEQEIAKAPEGETRENTAEGMGDATKRVRDKL